jgi:transcriptional regulator with XRE-family HTH domain
MELQNIIGSNLQAFRQRIGLTQDQIAEFLNVDRSLISHYEKGSREVTYVHLKNLSHLFNVEVEDFVEENRAFQELNYAFAFRSEGLDSTDLKSIAEFQRVVKNYIEMDTLCHEKK